MAKHWRLECQCGKRFRSYSAEAVHRHNFPALCKVAEPKPGETLVWTRVRDGEHNDKPVYEYEASAGNRTYRIVWAYNAGFGISAYRRKADGTNESLNERGGIAWCRTFKNCKARAETLEKQNVEHD